MIVEEWKNSWNKSFTTVRFFITSIFLVFFNLEGDFLQLKSRFSYQKEVQSLVGFNMDCK